jgi:hypothetical protein
MITMGYKLVHGSNGAVRVAPVSVKKIVTQTETDVKDVRDVNDFSLFKAHVEKFPNNNNKENNPDNPDNPDQKSATKSPLTQEEAERVALKTEVLLEKQGWCLWKCVTLKGAIILIVRDASSAYPEGYPVYTEPELEMLGQDGIRESTLRLVYQAKQNGGAVVISVDSLEINTQSKES